MFPTLFDSSWVGLDGDLHFTVSSYFAAILWGIVLAMVISYRDARRVGMSRQQFFDLFIWLIIAGVLGSRLMHVLVDGFFWDYVRLCTDPFAMDGRVLPNGVLCEANTDCLTQQARGMDIGAICNPEDGSCYPQRDCFRWLKFWAGGLTIYGALISCMLIGYFYLKKHGLAVGKIMDIAAYAVPLAMGVGRLGCLAAGCCFGGVCEIEWLGVQFPVGSLAYQHHFEEYYAPLKTQWDAGVHASLPVYPTQLIYSLYMFAIFLIAFFIVRPRKRFEGQVMLVTAALYAVCRFGLEFLRDDARGAMFGFSTSQWLSMLTLGVVALIWWNIRGRDEPKQTEHE